MKQIKTAYLQKHTVILSINLFEFEIDRIREAYKNWRISVV